MRLVCEVKNAQKLGGGKFRYARVRTPKIETSVHRVECVVTSQLHSLKQDTRTSASWRSAWPASKF